MENQIKIGTQFTNFDWDGNGTVVVVGIYSTGIQIARVIDGKCDLSQTLIVEASELC